MRLRILLVEDHADCALSTVMMLRLWGHEVEVATDGPAALQAAQALQPDVVLLDIGLPGMDGWAVAKRMRAQPKANRLLIVALTGYGRKADIGLSVESGIAVHLTKPVDPDRLRLLLDNWQATLARKAQVLGCLA